MTDSGIRFAIVGPQPRHTGRHQALPPERATAARLRNARLAAEIAIEDLDRALPVLCVGCLDRPATRGDLCIRCGAAERRALNPPEPTPAIQRQRFVPLGSEIAEVTCRPSGRILGVR